MSKNLCGAKTRISLSEVASDGQELAMISDLRSGIEAYR